MCEIRSAPDYGDYFVWEIADLITDLLATKWPDKEIIHRILASALDTDCKDLLEQYLHSQLEIIGRELNREFEIDEKVATEFATHAKLDNHVKAIKQKIHELKAWLAEAETRLSEFPKLRERAANSNSDKQREAD